MVKKDQTSKRTFYIEATTTTGTTRKFTVDNPKEISIHTSSGIVTNSIGFTNLGYALITGRINESEEITLNAPSISTDLMYSVRGGYDQTVNTILFDNMNQVEVPSAPTP